MDAPGRPVFLKRLLLLRQLLDADHPDLDHIVLPRERVQLLERRPASSSAQLHLAEWAAGLRRVGEDVVVV